MKCSTTAVSTEVLRRFALLLLALLLSSGHALTEDVAPAGEDIAAYINSGHYQFSLGGDAEWNSQIFINTANRGRLAINGNFNTIALRAGGISLLRDFTVDNDISITNTIFRPADPHPAANDYLIGIATANVNTTLRLAGTTFDG
ncbi:MAG: hypothetical protein LUG50_04260, partial [Planctomycetaceae bacterium]|nr:hypothetical protein [Planctomycetaceae bacterium]